MFENLKARIQMQAHEMRNGDHIRDMRDDAAFLLADAAPKFTGTLVRNLTLGTPVRESESGFECGLGDRNLIGFENKPAPRGTIAEFLKDNPEFIRKPEQRSGGKAQAWRDLPQEGKDLLQQGRESGLYGGSDQGIGSGKSAYFFPQEGSLDGWGDSAMKADIMPLHFVEHAMDEWAGESLPKMRSNLKNRTGWK